MPANVKKLWNYRRNCVIRIQLHFSVRLRKTRNFRWCLLSWWNKISANWRQQAQFENDVAQKTVSAISQVFSFLGTVCAASARVVGMKPKKTLLFVSISRIFFYNFNPHVQKKQLLSLTARENYLISDSVSVVFSVTITQPANRTESLASGAWDVEIFWMFDLIYCTFYSPRSFQCVQCLNHQSELRNEHSSRPI